MPGEDRRAKRPDARALVAEHDAKRAVARAEHNRLADLVAGPTAARRHLYVNGGAKRGHRRHRVLTDLPQPCAPGLPAEVRAGRFASTVAMRWATPTCAPSGPGVQNRVHDRPAPRIPPDTLNPGRRAPPPVLGCPERAGFAGRRGALLGVSPDEVRDPATRLRVQWPPPALTVAAPSAHSDRNVRAPRSTSPCCPNFAAEVTSLHDGGRTYYGRPIPPGWLSVVDKLAQAERDESERRKQLPEALCKAAGIGEHLDIGALTAWIRTSVAIRRSVATAEGT